MYFFSQLFKPSRQVTMKRIACEIERVEMAVRIKMVSRAEVMLIKTVEMEEGWGLRFGVIPFIGRFG